MAGMGCGVRTRDGRARGALGSRASGACGPPRTRPRAGRNAVSGARGTSERTRRIVVEMAPRAPAAVEPSARLSEDLGYDSLALIELALALESEFGLGRVSDEEALDVTTVGDVEDLIRRMLELQEPAR